MLFRFSIILFLLFFRCLWNAGGNIDAYSQNKRCAPFFTNHSTFGNILPLPENNVLEYLKTSQVIDTLDTVFFDIKNATVLNNVANVPVYFHATQVIQSLDFSLKYKQANLEFDTIINLTNGLAYLYHYNLNDSTLRFTSYRIQPLALDSPIVYIQFTMFNGSFCPADLLNVTAYLNGDECSRTVSICYIGTGEQENSDSEFQISCYPNPVNTKLTVITPIKSEIMIYDFSGKQIVFKSSPINDNMYELDLSEKDPGIYFIKIILGNKVFSKKIVVIH